MSSYLRSISPTSGTPYDDDTSHHSCHPPPGAKFKTFKEVYIHAVIYHQIHSCLPHYTLQVSYLYTSYPEERLPLSVTCDLLNQPTVVDLQLGSAMTFVPSMESSPAHNIGYLFLASGPDLCTLSKLH